MRYLPWMQNPLYRFRGQWASLEPQEHWYEAWCFWNALDENLEECIGASNEYHQEINPIENFESDPDEAIQDESAQAIQQATQQTCVQCFVIFNALSAMILSLTRMKTADFVAQSKATISWSESSLLEYPSR